MQLFFGLTLLAGVVYAQNSTNTTTSSDLLVSALKSLGLDAAAAAIDLVAEDPRFQSLMTELGAGNKTFFVPTNFLLSQAQSFASDIPGAVRTFDYQIARGQLSPSDAPVAPSHAISPSLLTDNLTVLLKGGDAQWIVATKQDDGNLHILNQPTDIFVKQSQGVDSLNVVINVIDNFLVPPGNLSATLAGLGLTQFQASLQKAGLLDSLASERGVTIFAPSNSAFASANSALSGVDDTTLKTILQNHVINTTMYSPDLRTEQLSTTGQTLHLSSASVAAGGNSAKLSQTDVGLTNGVLHIIDTVLMDKSTGPSSGARSMAVNVIFPITISALAVAVSYVVL